MYDILLALHLLFAVFAIGPLVHAASTASRGVRTADAAATASSARMLRIYAYVSVVVVIVGFGLMSATAPWNPDERVASFGETWIWLSVLLWVVAVALVLAVLVPTLEKATTSLRAEPPADVAALTGRLAAAGGVVALIFAGIVFLMVYRPGG